MNKSFKIASYVICALLLAIFSAGCNQGSGSDATPSSANSTTSTSNASTASSPATKDISGSYTISGQNEGGGGNYSGELTVTKRDEVYQFSWKSGQKTYDGVGVQSGNSVGVSFTEGSDGKGCGVVLYTIKPDGNLDGKSGYWGINEAETETATRTSGTDLDGSYEIRGTNTEGKSYEGKLNVKKQGAGYGFEWNTGNTLKGFGIRGANTAAVGIGGVKCGFVGYDVQPDGSLEGKWGSAGSPEVGTEVARKK